MTRWARNLLVLVVEFPVGTLIALSFLVIAVFLGVERAEQSALAGSWLASHRASVVLFKQVLMAASVPGLVLIFVLGKRRRRP